MTTPLDGNNIQASSTKPALALIHASSPGKLFLLGEYAVLHGAPALLIPVSQQAIVQLTRGSETCMITDKAQCQPTPDALTEVPLLKHVLATLQYRSLISERLIANLRQGNLALGMDTSAFYRQGKKLGLGSSAALTASLVKVLLSLSTALSDDDLPLAKTHRLPTPTEMPSDNEMQQDKVYRLPAPTTDPAIIQAAIDCHRAFQDGTGSGADVALAMAGSPIVFQLPTSANTISSHQQQPIQDDRVSSHQLLPVITPITLPPDLFMLFIWTGKPASTSEYLQDARNYQQDHPITWDSYMTQLGEISHVGIEALQQGKTETFLASVRQYDLGLSQLSLETDLGFYTPAHEQLKKQVKLAGCVYKPSGAGGGDFGIAYSTSRQDISKLAVALQNQGNVILLDYYPA